MSKDKITDYDETASGNEDVGGVGIQGTSPSSNMDNGLREIMSHLAEANAGTNPVADTWTFGDPANLTKRARLDAGGVTAGQTRVLAAPNFDGVLYSPKEGTAIDDDDIDGSDILTLPTDGTVFAMSGTQDVDAIAASTLNRVVFRHSSARTFTHHATDLICPGGVNLVVASGDVTEWLQYASGDWICANVRKANGGLAGTTGSAPSFSCRAWVYFDGTGTPSIIGSGNVSSITDLGAGYYTINFTTAMPHANYAVHVTIAALNNNGVLAYESRTTARSTSSVTVFVGNSGGTALDVDGVSVTVFA